MSDADYRWPPLDWTRPKVILRAVESSRLDELAERKPDLLQRRPDLADLRGAGAWLAQSRLWSL